MIGKESLALAKLPTKTFGCFEEIAIIFTRDSIYAIARICHGNSVCPSVCLSVTRVDQSKAVEARIT